MPQAVTLTTAGEAIRLQGRIDRPEKLLKRFGALLVSDSQKAFKDQALGDIAWPARYPNQRDPFINIAWALKDFAAGRSKPLDRRFQNRPAGIDTGETMRATSFRLVGPTAVEVGNPMPWANAMQRGGIEGVIPITAEMKKRMGKWLKSQKTTASWAGPEATDDEVAAWAKTRGMRYVPRKTKKATDPAPLTFMAQNPYLRKLGPLMKKSEYRIKGLSRPFVGVTDASRRYMIRAVEDFIAKGQIP